MIQIYEGSRGPGGYVNIDSKKDGGTAMGIFFPIISVRNSLMLALIFNHIDIIGNAYPFPMADNLVNPV